jgi:phosphoenolpyruvate carboxykinase (GTP)
LEIISLGSNYGGNSILGKKCVALRIASYIGQKEGWLAEHMLLIGLTSPTGETKYITGCFPSASGKTNLALIKTSFPGWTVTTLGDDITWLRLGNDGKLYGQNPETGMFGVSPNTSYKTNPNCMETIKKETIFTNVALTSDYDVWWENLTEEIPAGLIDWKGQSYTGEGFAAHPNSRFTVSMKNCPIKSTSRNWVPISAILFGGKRTDTIPLVRQSLSWTHGVYMGATITSEMTAAAEGKIGELRYDPFAMLPFCGYHFGNYFNHWLNISENKDLLPKIFYVNWFKKDQQGRFLWPGFSQNMRILQWIYHRLDYGTNGQYTPIGYIPENLNLEGLNNIDIEQIFKIDPEAWKNQLESDRKYLQMFQPNLPQELLDENIRMINELSSQTQD